MSTFANLLRQAADAYDAAAGAAPTVPGAEPPPLPPVLSADGLYAKASLNGAGAAAAKAYAADHAQLSPAYGNVVASENALTAAFNAALTIIVGITNGDTTGPVVAVAYRFANEAKLAFVTPGTA